MKSLRPVLLLVLVFVAGAVCGAVGARLAVRHTVRQAVAHPDRVRERIEKELIARLDLSAEQRTKVHAILADSQRQLTDLRTEYQPRFLAVLEKAREDVAATLSPEQRQKFNKFVARQQALWRPK